MKGMNQTQIEWADRTWNPIVGCSKGCPWCYAAAIAPRTGHLNFREVRFHPERLAQPQVTKARQLVFICSMGEFFDPQVKPEWQDKICRAMLAAPWHEYVILTKQADRVKVNHLPSNCAVGVSITCEADTARLAQLRDRAGDHTRLVASFEPLLGPVALTGANSLDRIGWVIIGGLSGPHARGPLPAWYVPIIRAARAAGAAVFVKDNIHAAWGARFPRERPSWWTGKGARHGLG